MVSRVTPARMLSSSRGHPDLISANNLCSPCARTTIYFELGLAELTVSTIALIRSGHAAWVISSTSVSDHESNSSIAPIPLTRVSFFGEHAAKFSKSIRVSEARKSLT